MAPISENLPFWVNGQTKYKYPYHFETKNHLYGPFPQHKLKLSELIFLLTKHNPKMAQNYPVHIDGTPSPVPYTTIATFPPGTFLENIAVRSNGHLLVSDMLSGTIHHLDPHAPNPQSTITKIHSFPIPPPAEETTPIESDQHVSSDYGTGMTGEAIIEDLRPEKSDIFYTFSGQHGRPGTWAVYALDMRSFSSSTSLETPPRKIAAVPHAVWLNGGTFLPGTSKLLMAESALGQLVCCDVDTGAVSIWLDDPLLGKMTDRPPYPAANGVQYFRGRVFVTNSDRGLLLCATVGEAGEYVPDSLTAPAEGLLGDDLAFDSDGAAYVATNPHQTVLKLAGVGSGASESERLIVLGSKEQAATAGPTAVAFGRTERDSKALYVVTTGGLIVPVGDGPGPARVLRVDVGVRGEI